MWPFIISRSVHLQRSIRASASDVLNILQNPDTLFRLSPLVVAVTPDPVRPSSFTVTEKLPILGYFESSTTFKCDMNVMADGFIAEVDANAGTSLRNQLTVVEQSDGTVLVSENIVVKGVCIFMPFIIGTMTKAHLSLFDMLASKVEEPKISSRQMNKHSSSPIVGCVIFVVAMFKYLADSNAKQLYFSLALSVFAVCLPFWSLGATDPYGLFHLSLNKLPHEDANTPPRTEWLNMGYWKKANVFPDACEALALKLISEARLKVGGKVLDVGYGTGQSLVLLLSNDSVPRPSRLVGVTSLETHCERSKGRIMKLQKQNIQVDLYSADAVCDESNKSHPLHPESEVYFNSILALDCAYHFDTRRRFLGQSFEKLAPGGRIALADICFAPSALKSLKTRLITSLLRVMPSANMISTEEYVQDMLQIGFVDVVLEDITEDVFPGFVKFLKGRGWGWWIFGYIFQWYAIAGARFVIVGGSKYGS